MYDTIQEACVGINSANQNASLQNVTGGVADCPATSKQKLLVSQLASYFVYQQ